jgi:hypothetical protein
MDFAGHCQSTLSKVQKQGSKTQEKFVCTVNGLPRKNKADARAMKSKAVTPTSGHNSGYTGY